MDIYESGEDYLETILILTQRNGTVRSIDVATELGYSKPSISRAIGILKTSGYVTVEKSGNILLTEKGLKRATDIYERHNMIAEFLIMTLGVDEEDAFENSCRIEHIISSSVFDKMKEYIEKNKDK